LSLRARVTESRQEPRAKVECPASTSKQRLVVPAFSTDLGLNAWGKCIVSGPQVMGRSQTVFSEDLSSRHRRSQEHKAALCPQAVPPHRHVLSTRVGNKNKSGVPWISRSLTTPTPTVGREGGGRRGRRGPGLRPRYHDVKVPFSPRGLLSEFASEVRQSLSACA
jgi:hypothetical protein